MDFVQRRSMFENCLRLQESYDLTGREIIMGGRTAMLYFAEGMVKDEMMEKMMEYFLKLTPEEMDALVRMEDFIGRHIPNLEVEVTHDLYTAVTGVLSGCMTILIEGISGYCVMDIRTYPVRAITEPEDDRVMRGAKDGFVETMQFNTALIRRRIRDTALTMEFQSAGTSSKTDMVLCYIKGKADEHLLERLREKIRSLDVETLNMGHESISEALVDSRWYNPFPKVRFTQRPDCACAELTEGRILLLVDTSPAAMILPTSLFDFMQETNDYYFPPTVGTYLRLIRLITMFMTVFFIPVWYLLQSNPEFLPQWLRFITQVDEAGIPVALQLLLIDLSIDGLKLASLNTPSMLNNSFSVVGGLILGEFAVTAGWLSPQVILYAAFVSIANFTQPSYELGYALKLCRILILVLTALLGVWGFALGTVIVLWLMATNSHLSGNSYLSPLIPLKPRRLIRLFIRTRITPKD